MTITNTGDLEFVSGFMAGQLGKEIPEDASQKWLEAYGRGYETSERESAIAEQWERKNERC